MWFNVDNLPPPQRSPSSVVDLGGRPPPYGPKFSQFHAVFRKIWQNYMLAPPEGWRPLLQGILDPPLIITQLRGSNIGGMSGIGRYVALLQDLAPSVQSFPGLKMVETRVFESDRSENEASAGLSLLHSNSFIKSTRNFLPEMT